jgi:hypothetical protein
MEVMALRLRRRSRLRTIFLFESDWQEQSKSGGHGDGMDNDAVVLFSERRFIPFDSTLVLLAYD